MEPSENNPQWERQVLEKIALESLKEIRAKRRWGIFFKLAGLAYLIAVLVFVVEWDSPEKLADGKHTALINIRGTIEGSGDSSADSSDVCLRLVSETGENGQGSAPPVGLMWKNPRPAARQPSENCSSPGNET